MAQQFSLPILAAKKSACVWQQQEKGQRALLKPLNKAGVKQRLETFS